MSFSEIENGLRRHAASRAPDLKMCVAGLESAIARSMAEELKPFGLTPMEFGIIRRCMEAEEGCTTTQLARLQSAEPSHMSRIVARLVDRGLMSRRRLRSDRRIVRLRLSKEGEKLTLRILRRMRAFDARLTEGIGEEEMRVFSSVAFKMIANHAAMTGPGRGETASTMGV